MNVSQTSKVFLVFGMLTSYLSTLEEPNRSKARSYYKKFFTLGNGLWKEMKITQKSISENVDYAYDELEEYLMKIVDIGLDIPIDRMEEFIKLINNFKDGWNR